MLAAIRSNYRFAIQVSLAQHAGSARCLPRPLICTLEEAAVCGRGGVTYANACTANGAGTGIHADGPCVSL